MAAVASALGSSSGAGSAAMYRGDSAGSNTHTPVAPSAGLFAARSPPPASGSSSRGPSLRSGAASPPEPPASSSGGVTQPDGVPEDVLDEQEFPEPICGGCKQLIDEDSADQGVIHFATQLWHVDCFRCAKCQNPVLTDRDDILLLSDGHPICGQCNYSCQICGLPIMEEAIMTGDESYHASCFTCRSCHTPIEELVFAKTSQGIYCMNCHNERVARSRRNAHNKRKGAKSSSRSNGVKENQPPSAPLGSARSPSAQSLTAPSPILGEPASSSRRSQDEGRSGDSGGLSAPNGDGSRASMDENAGDSASGAGSPWQGSLGKTGGASTKRPVAAPPPPTLRELRAGYAGVVPAGGRRPVTAESPLKASSSGGEPGPSAARDMVSGSTSSVASHASGHSRTRSASSGPSVQARSPMPSSDGARSSPSSENPLMQPLRTPTKPGFPPPSSTRVGLGIEERGGAPPSSAPPTTRTYDEAASEQRDEAKKSNRYSMRRQGDAGASKGFTTPTIKRSTDEPPRLAAPMLAASPPRSYQTDRLSRAFSFYDPDFVNLMDTFGQFDSSEDLRLSPSGRPSEDLPAEEPTTPAASDEVQDKLLPLSPPSIASARAADEAAASQSRKAAEERATDEGLAGLSSPAMSLHPDSATDESRLRKQSSTASLQTIQAKMRESIRSAQDGHVSMDTSFVESILLDLDQTKERMKSLQHKYDRMKRASQHAARGFSSAREEFEAEVQARLEAEAEMLVLKKQLVDQASKLSVYSTEQRKQENLQRRSAEVKTSLQGLERDLAKLTVERDLTVAEVAELVALQESKSGLRPPDGASVASSERTTALSRNLSVRLEGVKDKYRKEIDELTFERDALLIEIEELKQSRDTYLEESRQLNQRNDELNGILAQLTRRMEDAEIRTARLRADGREREQLPPLPSSTPVRGASSHGSSMHGRGYGSGSRSTSATTETFPTSAASDSTYTHDQSSIHRLASPVVTKIEAAPPKKFKWMKPKLHDSAKAAVAAAAMTLPLGHSPPVPPKAASATGEGGAGSGSQLAPGSAQPSAQGLSSPAASSGQAPQSSGQRVAVPNEIVVREHLFQPFSMLRPVRCFACQKSMWGQSEVRCALCGQACHQRCLQSLPTSCNQPFSRSDEPFEAGPSMFGRPLIEQVAAEGHEVPLVVEKCIAAVEAMGMDYEGIYRKSGGTSQLRVITQLFERGQPFDLEDVDRFNDVSAITSVLKNYFRELPEPLLTFELHEQFIEAAEIKNDAAQRDENMRALVARLPRQHRDTLRCLIRHLHRVRLSSDENRMNARNLGVVFGPTLMRSGDPSKEFAHMGGKAMTIEYMIEHPNIFDKA